MIDLRCCAFPMSGTQIQALQLVRALSTTAQIELGVLLPEIVDTSVTADVAQLPASIRRYGTSTLPSRRPHIFHCPYQLLADQDLGEALTLGDRLVITQQDMIMNHTPSYFRNLDDWRRFVDTTDNVPAADDVAFFSPHAMADALSDGVLSAEKASVVPIGTDHLSGSEEGFIDLPAALRLEAGIPFLLVIGNAYAGTRTAFMPSKS